MPKSPDQSANTTFAERKAERKAEREAAEAAGTRTPTQPYRPRASLRAGIDAEDVTGMVIRHVQA